MSGPLELSDIFRNPNYYLELSFYELCNIVSNLYREDIDFIRGDSIKEKTSRLRNYLNVSYN